MEIEFSINGKVYRANPHSVPVDTSLSTFIRDQAHLKGTKFMCLEGGCGSCVVNLTEIHPVSKEPITKAVNSCLTPVYSCHGRDVLTVEGIGNKQSGHHPVQKRLAEFNGSQCGYCSAGMVMNMYSLLEANDSSVTMREVEDAFDGNICRCTGYRPIMDAFKSFATDTSEKIINMCGDIEDLASHCSRKDCNIMCSKASPKRAVHTICADGREWHTVYSVTDIFDIFEKIGDRPYMLVGGNTAHGVYRRPDDLEVFIDVNSVEELHRRTIGLDLIVGANTTLHDFVSIMNEATIGNHRFQYFKRLVDHVLRVANTPVRNAGTIAGNLMIKHQHPEFPSDIFLLLETVGATLTIATDGLSLHVTPLDFLKVDMAKKLLTIVTIPSLDPAQYMFRSFKVMPVAQNSRAYVNAAFLVKFCRTGKTTELARVCFGGINPSFVHAYKTEDFLLGRPLFTNETLQEALKILSTELRPDWVLPDASPKYRKNLALSLFYKFLLSTTPESTEYLNPRFRSGGTTSKRPVSSGKQSYDTYPNKWPLTQYVPKIEGLAQSSGEAEYIGDIPERPNELHAAFVLATEIQSRISKIDATEALKLPGVVAFYSAKNIPGINNFMPLEMGAPEVDEIFCSGVVAFHGQPVGVVVAKTFELANRAAALVEISYEKIVNHPVYVTVEDVIEGRAYNRVFNQHFDRHGAKFLSASEGPIKINGQLDLKGQYHYTMETQTCFCIPVEDGLDIYSSTQFIDNVMIAVSQALNVPENSLNISVRRLGGAYGAKISRASQIACACALAAQLTQCPVRMVLKMETNMSAVGKRGGSHSEYEVDVDSSGKINRLNHTYTQDSGVTLNEGFAFLTVELFKNCYRTDRWNLVGNIARTDVPSNTWCRAPGSSEGMAMIENIMEHIAHVVEKDPLEVRMLNISKENKMYNLLPRFRADVDFDDRKQAIDMFNLQNRWHKRGIAIIPMEYDMEYSQTLNALVSIYHLDGSVAITHGAIEMGQGVNTKVVQVAAHILGIPLNKIAVKPSTGLTSPNCGPSVHSRASETAAFAVKKSCEILMERLRPIQQANPQAPWEQIVAQAFVANVDLSATYHYQPSDLQAYVIWGLACAEIEVDILTGNIQIPRVDILEDVGESMSPGIDVGQVEGAFIMGLGYYLTEALVYEPSNGALLTTRSWNYKVPGNKDIPIDFRVEFLRKSSNPFGVLRSKAVGEPAFSMSPVLTYALRYALRSARKDAGLPDDWIPIGSATTPEKIFLMAGNSLDQYKLN
ncbi:xanthine dehydrogenase-like [Toxorhynchites rutilus septentrionalis]|uniref:xanthine dehydrogenase-like n=1 Tax=Toxorhynchites rutilus septentrionalis TaxID=329112 RepID=UPI00247A6CB8|nr:xanthine dehydrogenase-like [Toxorhynchites rutilus septentrionalis]